MDRAPAPGSRGPNRRRPFRNRRALLGALVVAMLVGLVLLAWTGLQSRAEAAQLPPVVSVTHSPWAVQSGREVARHSGGLPGQRIPFTPR